MEKVILLVAEGETDIIVLNAISKYLSNDQITYSFHPLSPQRDATSNTYNSGGFGSVLNWCSNSRESEKAQMLLDFGQANALFIHLDTDIAKQINLSSFSAGKSARICCEEALNIAFSSSIVPEYCHYILPTQNTETWILASHSEFSLLDSALKKVDNYELITDTEQMLIKLGYSGKKKGSRKVLNKNPARKYIPYARRLIENLPLAKQRCPELDDLCNLILNA